MNTLGELCLEGNIESGRNIWCQREVMDDVEWNSVDTTQLNRDIPPMSYLVETLPSGDFDELLRDL